MIFDNQTQIWCINNGMTSNGVLLLSYLHSQFFPFCITYKDIANDMPIFFPEKKPIKEALENLESCGIICFEDSRISAKIEWRHTRLREMFDSKSTLIIQKERVKKEKPIQEETDDIKIVMALYNTLGNLKPQKNVTAILRGLLEEKIGSYGADKVVDALKFANDQQWVASKIDEIWCNCSWIIKNIEGFMEGGKYRRDVRQEPKKPAYQYVDEGDIII